MRIYLDTTIQELFDKKQISTRTYNCLRYAGLVTLGDVVKYAEPPAKLMNLKNFGRKSYVELEPLIKKMQLDNEPLYLGTAEESFVLVNDTIEEIMKEAYDSLFIVENDVNRFFKASYPSVKELHRVVMGNKNQLMKIYCEFTLAENIEIRRMYVSYLENVMNRMQDMQQLDNDTYLVYKSRLTKLLDRLEEFSYQDKTKFFISPSVRSFLQRIYVYMYETQLSTRARHFVEQVAPRFEDLAQYLDSAILDYGGHCSTQSQKKTKTLTEVINFNKQFKEQFDRYWQMSEEEVQEVLLSHDYPHLNSVERKFVIKHGRAYGVYPMFFLLYNYMRTSEKRNNKIFSLLYGIFDGQERSYNELAVAMSLTSERIRQIISRNKLEVHNTGLIMTDAWASYNELLSLSFVTAKTVEYQQLKNRELLNFDFRIFARLMQLLGDRDFEVTAKNRYGQIEIRRFNHQYEIEIVGNVAIVINRKKMPLINIGDCINSLQSMVSLRYTNDTHIDVVESLNTLPIDEKKEAIKLMSYVAKEGLNLELDKDNHILVRKNHIDVAEELYNFLDQKGEPMSVNELFITFKEKHPKHKFTEPSQIRPYLYKHLKIKAIGKTSCYGLDTWENVYYGSIRDLLLMLLTESEEPIHLDDLFKEVVKHYPDTNPESLSISMCMDSQQRFVQFDNGYYGLQAMAYDKKWKEYNSIRRQSFNERLADFCEFVNTYKHYPLPGNGDDEASLYRWLYNIQNEKYEVKDTYKERLTATLARYEADYIPRNNLENEFLNKCRKYRAYVISHDSLPTASTAPRLYRWMARSKANYNSYTDYRRKYITDLFNYLISLGFSI